MRIDQFFVTGAGTLLICFIYWFFFMKKEKAIAVKDSIEIYVEGGYDPQVISIKKGQPTKLTFIRKDPSPCLEEVVLSDFGIRKHLPLNERVTVEITPSKVGEFSYACGMNMYHGKIVVT